MNVVLLSCVFVVLGLAGRKLLEPDPDPPTGSAPAPSSRAGSPAPRWSGLDAGSGADGGSGQENAGERLVIPGLQADRPVAPATEAAEAPELNLPVIDPSNVTPELIDELVALAGKHPDQAGIRHAVARAYLALAYRRFAEGGYQEALRRAKEAERWGAAPRDVARVCASASLELRDLARAIDWAQAALAFGPDAEMYDVLGQVFYLREEMDKAIEAWKSALALREDPKIRARLEKALREMSAAEGFDRQRLSHFIVRYEGDTMEETGRMVLGSLERSHSYLKSTLGFEPAEPVVVILYGRRDYMELGGPNWSAGLFDGKVRIPIRGLKSLDRHVETTLRHELTHAFIHARAGEDCPRWLHEGLAEYCEGTRSEQFGGLLAQKIQEDGDFAYCLLGQRCDVRFFYPACASVVEYVLRSRGMGGIRDILSGLGDGLDIDAALEKVLGKDEMGLVNEWQHFVKRRYL